MNEREKIEEMYELYEQEMYRIAYAVLRDEFAAEDAVHDAFVRLIHNSGRIKEPLSSSAEAYAKRAVKSTAIDMYRKRKRETERCEELDEKAVTAESEFFTDGDNVDGIIAFLPEKYAQAVKLRFVVGLSTDETAAVLKISPSCVKKRIERAKKMLADLLENEKNRGIKHE